jgi:hypothetical protein
MSSPYVVGTLLLAICAAAAALQLLFGYALQGLADKRRLPASLRVLAWIPGANLLCLVRCAGGSLASFAVGAAVCLASAVILVASAWLGIGDHSWRVVAAGALLGLLLAGLVYLGLLFWRAARLRGLPGPFGLTVLFPPLGALALLVIAFHDGFTRPSRLGLALGSLVVAGSLVAPVRWAAELRGMRAEPAILLEHAPPPREEDPPERQALDSLAAMLEIGADLGLLDRLDPGNPEDAARMDETIERLREQVLEREAELDDATVRWVLERLAEQRARLDAAEERLEREPDSLRAQSEPPPDQPGPGTEPLAPRGLPAAPPARLAPPDDPAADPAGADALRAPTDLPPCPPGTALHGAAPPGGYERWCERLDSPEGVRHGWYVAWHQDGSRAEAGRYRDGLRVGTWTRWHPNGRKSLEAEFRDGVQHGWLVAWDETGRKLFELRFEEGEPVEAARSPE